MTERSRDAATTSSMAEARKSGALVRSAESRRMQRLANIPSVERRQAALNLLLKRAK